MMLAAIETPNTAPSIRNRIWLALEVAVSAASPSWWLTQTALAEPLSDCRMLEPSTGRAKAIRVLPIGPVVRSGPRRMPPIPAGGPPGGLPTAPGAALSELAVTAVGLLGKAR